MLEPPAESKLEVAQLPAKAIIARTPVGMLVYRKILPQQIRGTLSVSGKGTKNLPTFAIDTTDNCWDAGFNDPAFLSRNLSEGGPKLRLVVETNAGDYRNKWRQDVGRVKSPTKSDLNDRNINTGSSERAEGEYSHQLERRQFDSRGFDLRTDRRDSIDHFLFANPPGTEADALTKIN